ncbi:aquaporin AQPAn.G isoform X3 [Folsomia candida]|uniref:aquaporin AQPAn.G isoform X3 n=1 Tax=Folsomia candida TaxID=158441 RepID=UPI000B906413|nr:aquaporin AQPAn.G isoform X3 [Folsomia candida]
MHQTILKYKADALAMATIQLKMPRKDIWRALIAELIGTCLLIIMGCGSILSLTTPKALDLTGIGLCWGMTVATLAQTLGHVSGCHMNPAVSLAMMVTGKLQLIKAGLYIGAQCIGAMMGAAVLKALTPDEIVGDWGITKLGPGVTPLQGFGIEFVATFVLLMVIFGATDENRTDLKGSAPLAIGLCITALVLFCGPFTGASMNPARTLGPSVVASHFDNHWVYWIGPISGAITAAVLYHQIFRAFSPEEVATIQAEEDIKKREGDAKEGAVPNV